MQCSTSLAIRSIGIWLKIEVNVSIFPMYCIHNKDENKELCFAGIFLVHSSLKSFPAQTAILWHVLQDFPCLLFYS